jgi:N-acetylmuramoyl-L-alanine amidase
MPHLPDPSNTPQLLPKGPADAPPPSAAAAPLKLDPWLLQLGAIALLAIAVLGWLAYAYSRQPDSPRTDVLSEDVLSDVDLLLEPLASPVQSRPLSSPPQSSPAAQPPQLPAPPQHSTPVPPKPADTACRWTAAPPPAQVFAFPTDPTNFGDRQPFDASNQPVASGISLIVLHETVAPLPSVLQLFHRSHPDDASQVSYHMLIARNGTLIQTVPPEKRAFGAGNSEFQGESVQINPTLPGSVNNFAYHISLESPADGMNQGHYHSGYTAQQYRSLAYWSGLIMQIYGIPWERITTHRAVDRSGTRRDPRSFDWPRLQQELGQQQALACQPAPRRAG